MGAGGHGGQGALKTQLISVTPGSVLTIRVGAGGSGGESKSKKSSVSGTIQGNSGGNGGTSAIDILHQHKVVLAVKVV